MIPFTVLAEPRTVELLRGGSGGDMAHILDAQLMEADLIVLNKCDLISEEQAGADRLWLSQRYPEAQALCISALTEDGLEELSLALRDGAASLRHPDIDYEDIDLQNEMGSLSEHYIQYHATVCCFTFDGTAYLTEPMPVSDMHALAKEARTRIFMSVGFGVAFTAKYSRNPGFQAKASFTACAFFRMPASS